MAKSVAERFWAKVDKRGPNDCWLWTASARPDGYGQFSCNGRPGPAHAMSYRLECGEVPFRAYVRHSCENKLCVNPAHLTLETDESRFWAKVEKADGCWNWTGARSPDGYGLFKVDAYRAVNAHRYSFECENGPIGKSYVCHKCDNRRCVRPDHLFLGDVRINWADMVLKGRHPNMRSAKAIALAVAILGANSAAANTVTPNYSLNKPTVGADANNWGNLSNANWDSLDSIVFGVSGVANGACPKTGCTYTGDINIGTNTTGHGVVLNGPAASFRTLYFQTASLVRWTVFASNGAESGGNAGSDFCVGRSNDAGSGIDQPLCISRTTGLATFADGLTVIGGITGTLTGNVAGNVTGNLTGNASGNAGTATKLASSRNLSTSGDVVCGPNGFDGSTDITLSGCALATSGVTAATYGDATHVAQVTVDAKGRVTSASNVALPAMARGYWTACSSGCFLNGGSGLSISRSSAGHFNVTVSGMPNANYTVACTAGTYSSGANANTSCVLDGSVGRFTSSFAVRTYTGGNNPIDPDSLDILVISF